MDIQKIAEELKKIIWIPCAKMLPETTDEVLITAVCKFDGEREVAISSYIEATLGGQKLGYKEWSKPWDYFHSNYDVVAWKPLPEPYKDFESNADNIRSMTDEQLAHFLIGFKNTFGEEYEGEMSCLDWLQKEVEE